MPLTLVPAVIYRSDFSWKWVVLFVAHFLTFVYAFMINEVEDAEDDRKNKNRELVNPIALGRMSYTSGWWSCQLVAILAIVFYAGLGKTAYLIGAAIVSLSLFYSWKKVRLKAWPIMDIVSHTLVLGGLQFVISMLVIGKSSFVGWVLALIIIIVSAHGQLHNQLRDFAADKKAGIKNTTWCVGGKRARLLKQFCLLVVAALALGIVLEGIIPLFVVEWFVVLTIAAMLFRRGGEMVSRKGEKLTLVWRGMLNVSLVANAVIVVWLIGNINWQEKVRQLEPKKVWMEQTVQNLLSHSGKGT
jgi:4-hydroxybenzoate polyprenyltransferase